MVYVQNLLPPAGERFAENMCYTRKFVRPLVDSIIHLEHLRLIPNLLELSRFYIYTHSRDWREFGSSIVLRTPSCHFFVMEISCNCEYDGRPRLFLRVDAYRGQTDDLVFRGRIWSKGFDLIYGAFNMVDRLGYYFKFRNQANRFAEKFLTTLGIGYHTCLQDYERVTLYSFGYSAADVFKHLFERTPRPTRPDRDVYMIRQMRRKEDVIVLP